MTLNQAINLLVATAVFAAATAVTIFSFADEPAQKVELWAVDTQGMGEVLFGTMTRESICLSVSQVLTMFAVKPPAVSLAFACRPRKART
jgi:hypothetical protein